MHQFKKSTSSILLTQKKNTIAFQKQAQSILEVYFITKSLMESNYKYIQKYMFQCKKLWKSISPKVYLRYTSYLEYKSIFEV